nr:reverse transcriptase domain-containing protein [Tanacetum cinerariifolium]
MLGEHNITHRPRTSVKGQVLANFLAEMPDKSPPDASVVETQQEPWTLFTDGSLCVDGSGAGLILTGPEGTKFTYALRFSLQLLTTKQSQKPGQRLRQLFYKPSTTKQKQESGCPEQDCVNQLCALIQTDLGRNTQRKIHTREEVTTVVEEDGPTWMTPIIEYLKEGTLPGDRKEANVQLLIAVLLSCLTTAMRIYPSFPSGGSIVLCVLSWITSLRLPLPDQGSSDVEPL